MTVPLQHWYRRMMYGADSIVLPHWEDLSQVRNANTSTKYRIATRETITIYIRYIPMFVGYILVYVGLHGKGPL